MLRRGVLRGIAGPGWVSRHHRLADRLTVALSVRDPAGSALLAAAVVVCVMFVWMLAAPAILVSGLLALAIVGVDYREELRRPC